MKSTLYYLLITVTTVLFLCNRYANAGEKLIVELKDFSRSELKACGFTLNSESPVHIKALGASTDRKNKSRGDMFAYGWIINSETREKVWMMDPNNTSRSGDDRKFDEYITLPKGTYEIYFTAPYFSYQSSFTKINTNVDHRHDDELFDIGGRHNFFFSWLEDWFGGDMRKEWFKRSKNWGVEIYIDEKNPVTMFNPPKDFPNILFRAVNLGENEFIKQGFSLNKPLAIHIYALGEGIKDEELSDYGYIVDAKTHKRIWEMKRGNITKAGGADKNIKFDAAVNFNAGSYIIYYYTDDSHSSVDWNDSPPYDPLNYGISLYGHDEKDKPVFKLFTPSDEENVIVSITKVGNDETRSEGFTLKKDANVRIYSIGERYSSRRQMADYGWIINAKTREKVWEMNVDKTVHAGGGSKNRMIDEVISLPKGSYMVFYQSDDSHSYDDWNVSPSYDPKHWGITVYAVDGDFDKSTVEKYIEERDKNIIAQIIKVRDNANLSETFKLTEPTRVRIYAIGEGARREMSDYGWVEQATTGKVVWEMTYSMTFHAGGARKNRLVNTTILLDKGEYRLRYVSDDSHSFNKWNDDPPDDAQYWGIILYRELEVKDKN
ncbi:MAG: hypothetical protein KJ963_01030 [Bacteroidetes bacterium]|nr:hypothetical protein [Bacteroidota bacterium]